MRKTHFALLAGVLVLLALAWAYPASAGQLSVGLSRMPNGHSEGSVESETRCVNDGFALDIGYDWAPFSLDFNKYLGASLRAGGLATYTNYETAFRIKSTAPMSDFRREHAVTLTSVLKPTLKLWIFKPYILYGVGVDYMQSEGFCIGTIEKGKGLDIDITDSMSIGVSQRAFKRTDGSFYNYVTGSFTITF